MLKKFLKQILGVDDLEARVQYLQSRVSEQDSQIIQASKQRELIAKAASEKNISDTVSDFLAESDIQLTSENKKNALIAISAAEAVEKYGFRKFNPSHDENSIKSSIISLREFAEHPEKYIHKSEKGVFSFPLNLNFQKTAELFEKYGNVGILKIANNFDFYVLGNSLEGYVSEDLNTSKTLDSALTLSRVNKAFSNNCLTVDPFDFLENYKGINDFVRDSPIPEKRKKEVLEALTLTKAVYVAGFDILAGTTIMATEDLISYPEFDESEYVIAKKSATSNEQRFYENIKHNLLSEMNGMRDYDIDKLLPIRSIDEFRRLASERTSEIIVNDSLKNGLTASLDKELSEYTPAEAILMSCYFARNIINSYKKPEDSVKNVLRGISPEGIEGKCTDYTGLALHYLREFIVPLNPEKFNHWQFGYEVDRIGNDYKHCFMKAVHQKPDGTHSVFYIDPTSLSSLKLEKLKTPENIVAYSSTENHPVQIIRDAEDLLYDTLNLENA